MTPLEDLEAQRRKIYSRMKEVRALVAGAQDADQRWTQQQRLRVLGEMYRDVCGQIDALRPPQERRHKAAKRSTIQTGALTFDFFERCGSAWADIEGNTWGQLTELAEEGSAREASTLLDALRRGMAALTEAQRDCILALYGRRMTVKAIAEERGVQPSTVSRTIRSGLRRLERCILASLTARQCAGPEGFDLLRFADETDVLSERQREYLYLLLTDGATLGDIARYLDVTTSTISRGADRVEANLSAVRPDMGTAQAARKVRRGDWDGKSEREVAEALGLSPAAYYRHVCRRETVGGLPRMAYEVLRLGDIPAAEAARALGITAATVRRYRRRYAGTDVSDIDPPERYTPRPRHRDRPDLRRLLAEARTGTIGDSIDAGTYRRMLEISTNTNRRDDHG